MSAGATLWVGVSVDVDVEACSANKRCVNAVVAIWG